MKLRNKFFGVVGLGVVGMCSATLVSLSAQAAESSDESAKPKTAEPYKKITAAPLLDEGAKADELPAQTTESDHAPASTAASHTVAVSAAPGTAAKAKPAATPAPAKAKEAARDPKEPVDSETSLRWLTNGNIRYVKKQFRADGRTSQDRERLMTSEHPHAIVLTCSDSRVPPEIVFDQELGEIYVIRVAGEALDNGVIASVEYALSHFSPRLMVVLGHTQCGAVEDALKSKDGDTNSDALNKLLADIRPRLKSIPEGSHSPNLEIEATVNADGVARDLVKRSDVIRKKVEAGELVIKPALYRMDSGKVSFY